MIVSANELNRSSPLPVSIWVAARASRLRPSMGGQIFQTSGATMRDPGILRRSSTMLAGRSLKTGAGELARMTISPFIFASVFPIKRADAVGQAEEPQDRDDRNRQAHDRQHRARRPRDQVLPGKYQHLRFPRTEARALREGELWTLHSQLGSAQAARRGPYVTSAFGSNIPL